MASEIWFEAREREQGKIEGIISTRASISTKAIISTRRATYTRGRSTEEDEDFPAYMKRGRRRGEKHKARHYRGV